MEEKKMMAQADPTPQEENSGGDVPIQNDNPGED